MFLCLPFFFLLSCLGEVSYNYTVEGTEGVRFEISSNDVYKYKRIEPFSGSHTYYDDPKDDYDNTEHLFLYVIKLEEKGIVTVTIDESWGGIGSLLGSNVTIVELHKKHEYTHNGSDPEVTTNYMP